MNTDIGVETAAFWSVRYGDVLEQMAELPDNSIHCVMTSPPYWGLRNYGVDGAYGLEPTLDEYLDRMVTVFREVSRVLRDDGTLWLNLGDAYWGSKGASSNTQRFKPKDLIGLPWRVVFALHADGWWLRSDIIWAKPNPMPESTTDRPTRSHEFVFLLTKNARYFYDADAIRELNTPLSAERMKHPKLGLARRDRSCDDSGIAAHAKREYGAGRLSGRNKHDVWNIVPQSYSGAHFATYPVKLVEPCVLAGTSAHGVCGECGAGWERAVDVKGGTIGQSWHDHSVDLEQGQQAPALESADIGNGPYRRQTTGWIPTCDHDAEPIPRDRLRPVLWLWHNRRGRATP